MSTTIAIHHAPALSLDNAGRAVINWLRALLATTPAALAVTQGCASREVASYYKVGCRMALLRRAAELDASAPQEAAALRKMAATV